MYPDDRVVQLPQRHVPPRPMPAPAPPRAHSASVAAYHDGFAFGVRHAWTAARAWWFAAGLVLGVPAGVGLVLLAAQLGVKAAL